MKYRIIAQIIASVVSCLFLAVITPLFASEEFTGFNQSVERKLWDGGAIKCYFNEAVLKEAGQGAEYADLVCDAAASAYSILTKKMRFPGIGDSQKYGFYRERDKTIEIYIGDAKKPNFKTSYFVPRLYQGIEKTWDALILVPNDPRVLEPRSESPLTRESSDLILFGTLMHEMTHIVTFQCNKNIKGAVKAENWYVEGLARFMETRIGSWSSFYARGYKRETAKGYAFCLKEGVNYFLANPNRPLEDLSYDYAIFWQYVNSRYGMEKIVAFSKAINALHQGGGAAKLSMLLENALDDDLYDIYAGFIIHLYGMSLSEHGNDKHVRQIAYDIFAAGRGKSMEAGASSLGIKVYRLKKDNKKRKVFFENKSAAPIMAQSVGEDAYGNLVSSKVVAEGRTTVKLPETGDAKQYIFIFNPGHAREARFALYAAESI